MIIYFLQLFLLPSTTATAGVFDLAEYRRVSYDANIGENFLWFAPELDIRKVTASNIDDLEKRIVNRIPDDSTEQNLMFVTSKGGQKFACSLPDVEDVKKDKPKSSKNPKIYGDALAASFYVDKCVKLRGNHWWSYILCRGQTIEQVHGEPGQEGYVKNILGLFDGSLKMPSYQESTDDRLLFVEETYTSGTFCDLEEYREPRMTSVRYECDAQLSTNEVYISSVVEVKPCQYLMIVKVGTLCRYPEFLPASQSNTKKIGCQPFLRKEDVRQLLERQLEEKQKAEESQRVLTVKKRKFQRAAERFNAMTKSQRNLHIPDVVKRINAEMDYHAAHFNLLVAGLELEGKPITQKKRDYMWKLFSTADISDYIFYSDYDTVNDENRGHLWYYFHDPSWPRNQFPKDIMATAVQNGYLSEVQKNLKGTQYRFGDNDELVEGLTHFLKTGEIDLQSNLVIPAMDIYDEMVFIGVRDQPYKWLYDLYEFYHEERDLVAGSGLRAQDVIEGMLHKILKPKYKSWFPMGNLARNSLVILLDEVWEDIIELSTNGLESELLDSSSPNYKAIYDMVDIGNASPEQLKTKNGKNLKFTVSVSAQRDLYEIEAEFQQLLTPIYKLLSIQWFQCRRPNYFHVHPPSEEHLEPSDTTEDFIFHMNLARDMSRFARLMTEVFVVKILFPAKMLIEDENIRYGGAQADVEDDAARKAQERELKKAEVRKRMEEAAKKGSKKKGFLTPERKKKLRKLLMMKAAEDLKQQQMLKEQERQKTLQQRTIPLPDVDSINDQGQLLKIYEDMFARVCALEEEKFDINFGVSQTEAEINQLTIQVNDLRGKFVKPTLKKVSKYDNKFKSSGEVKEKSNFRNNLKVVKKETDLDEIMAKKKGTADGKPEWSKKEKKEEEAAPVELAAPVEPEAEPEPEAAEPAAEEPEAEEEEEEEEEEE